MADETQSWDLVVVGGGTAGLVGAQTASSLGARVMLIEGERTGGDCTHAYPTHNDGLWNAAIAQTRAGLAKPAVRKMTGLLAAVRRRAERR